MLEPASLSGSLGSRKGAVDDSTLSFGVAVGASWSSDKGACLRLAVGLARSPEGAALLHAQGTLGCCVAAASWLVGPEGGALGVESPGVPCAGPYGLQVRGDERRGAPVCLVPWPACVRAGSRLPRPPCAGALAQETLLVVALSSCSAFQGDATDVLKAYADGRESPIHQQWLSLLSLQGALLRHLGAAQECPGIADEAVAFVVTAETRLLAALEPPSGRPSEPLTLAGAAAASRIGTPSSPLVAPRAPPQAPWVDLSFAP